jgi:hypothetical protein
MPCADSFLKGEFSLVVDIGPKLPFQWCLKGAKGITPGDWFIERGFLE